MNNMSEYNREIDVDVDDLIPQSRLITFDKI